MKKVKLIRCVDGICIVIIDIVLLLMYLFISIYNILFKALLHKLSNFSHSQLFLIHL